MKKSTLAFVFVFALLLIYVLQVEKKQTPHGMSSLSQGQPLFDFKPEEAKRLEITRGKQIMEFDQNNKNQWEIIKPFHAVADAQLCNNFIESLSELTSLHSINRTEPLSAYGLDPGSLHIHLELKSGLPIDLQVGAMDPTREGLYAYLPRKGELVLLSLTFGAELNRPIDAWRDHSINKQNH